MIAALHKADTQAAVRRILASLFLALLLLIAHGEPRAPYSDDQHVDVRFVPLPLPPPDRLAGLGAFRIEGAWHVTSPNSGFSGYSALLILPDGRLLALNDGGNYMIVAPPGALHQRGYFQGIAPLERRETRDTEGATRDPATGLIWQSVEGTNAIARLSPALRIEAQVKPALMRNWDGNRGPESLVRLQDGRFVTIRESGEGILSPHLHAGVVFADDPVTRPRSAAFTFDGPANFSVTDMAQLPDGRVLVLMRRLIWPAPERFASRLVLADPAAIRPGAVWHGREVARLASTMPIDNFEGIAVAPRNDGRLDVWIISDDNHATWQRTLLWRLSIDPARLP
jgi:hypothetical protein